MILPSKLLFCNITTTYLYLFIFIDKQVEKLHLHTDIFMYIIYGQLFLHLGLRGGHRFLGTGSLIWQVPESFTFQKNDSLNDSNVN